MKKLEMVFSTASDAELIVSFAYPKEDISLAEVRTAAEALVPILVTGTGVAVTAFDKANIITTTTEELE